MASAGAVSAVYAANASDRPESPFEPSEEELRRRCWPPLSSSSSEDQSSQRGLSSSAVAARGGTRPAVFSEEPHAAASSSSRTSASASAVARGTRSAVTGVECETSGETLTSRSQHRRSSSRMTSRPSHSKPRARRVTPAARATRATATAMRRTCGLTTRSNVPGSRRASTNAASSPSDHIHPRNGARPSVIASTSCVLFSGGACFWTA
mmetsp:Transcript_1443/g.5596  ORF Transcript_1443/g.5596 Transcript_1443/m.5596 type:complete len:209 (+) Transcript_1443:151-777(+)